MSWSVVVPTNRPREFEKFHEAWKPLFEKHDVNLIVVEDKPSTWKKIPDFIPRQTDMIRSWGFYRAWQTGCDYVLTLDDDVRPVSDMPFAPDPFLDYQKVFEKGRPSSKYFSTGALTSSGLEMRGFPYRDRKPAAVSVQYGGWFGVLDYDAATQITHPRGSQVFAHPVIAVPKGAPTTCCIMNCAFRRSFTPAMWQLPLLEGRYNRTGDIWSGLFQKKALDDSGDVMVINGRASVKHERASDPFTSLQKEASSLRLNEDLWDNLEDGDYKTVTDSAYAYFKRFDKEYAEHYKKSRDGWLNLFQ